MKKIIYLIIPLVGILVSLLASQQLGVKEERYHQHLEEAPGDLSIVRIETGNQEIAGIKRTGENTRVDIEIFEKEEDKEIPVMNSYADIKYRGNSSLHFDKKSYSVHLVEQDGVSNSQEIMGMAEDDDWILNGPYLDRTLLRNYMCLNIAGEIMEYAPNVRYCELYVDNRYQGLYLMMENVTRSPGRIDISGINKKLNKTGYVIRLDRGGSEISNLNDFLKYSKNIDDINYFNIEYPGSKNITPELRDYIEKDFSKFGKALYSFDYDDDEYGYHQFIDVNSFVDYFIINEMFMNRDAGSQSTYYYKDIQGKMKLCVWDFNNSLDNYMETEFNEEGFFMMNKPIFYMLVKDEEFINRIISRYHQLRQGVLGEEYLLEYIDNSIAFLGPAIDRNNKFWTNSFQPEQLEETSRLSPLGRNAKSYEEAVEQLKKTMVDRGRWLDENIDTLNQYAHESRTKKFNH